MFLPSKANLVIFTLLTCSFVLIPQLARGSNITLQGSFTSDDQVQLFDVAIATAGTVDIRSYGYAGGATSTGTAVPSGGFDTILTLFNAEGAFLTDNDEGSGVATDPSTGLAADARITTNVAAGTYVVALTQFDNFPIGNLGDGFAETGNPHFTADPSFTSGGPCPGNTFRDISGTAGRCRDGNWAVDFVNVASVTPAAPVAEPSGFALLGAGLSALGLLRIKRRVALVFAAVLVGGFSIAARAQEPDYSEVNDVLDGRRTLVAVNDVVIGGLVLKTTSGTNIVDKDIYKLTNYNPNGAGPEASVRMFDSIHDTVLYTNGSTIYAADPVTQKTTTLSLNEGIHELDRAAIATDDFNGDGFREVVIASNSGLRIVGALDPEDFSNGLYSGPALRPASYGGTNSNLVVAVGDFAGDGGREIALSYGSASLNNAFLDILTVDPKTLGLELKSHYSLVRPGSPFVGTRVGLAAGRFGATSREQLILAMWSVGVFVEPLTIRAFDFDSSLQPIQKDSVATHLSAGGEVVLKTGRFDPNSPYEQAAIKYDNGRGNVQLGVIHLDTTLKIHLPEFTVAPVACSTPGLAVGNFDRTEPLLEDPSQTGISFKLQLAIKTDNCAGRDMGLNIFNVEPPLTADENFTVIPKPAFTRTTNDPTWLTYLNSPIVAVDVQGRSYILGEPTRIVVADTDQPFVVQAIPPMHVDFIPPANGGPPEVLNVSGIPNGFYTTYKKTTSEKKESSTANTTSWGFGAKQNVEASVEIGSVENGFGAKAGAAFRAAQDLSQTIKAEHGNYQAQSFTAAVQTVSSDHVWFAENRFNIYVYPVIGQTVCPAAKADCADTEKVPLTIQFSGPDKTVYLDQDADILPWYQPPWEPFNLFSYPATFAQLKQIAPNLQQLSNDSTWSTDGSVRSQETTWTKESTNGSSVGFDQNYSFETELSVAGACCGGLVKGSLSAQLNLSGSSGFSDLNKAVATIGESTGIEINKPGTFLTPLLYNYEVTPYIFGEVPPAGKTDNTPPKGDIKTSGILRTAFVADPLVRNAGAWWQQTYSSVPDVALNHPARWHFPPAAATRGAASNCRPLKGGDSPMDCAVLASSFPNNPFLSLFHVMRGFFITSALNPGEGPQLSQARAGDKLALQTRVYNYSFASMPAGSHVHVRFYVQRFDNKKNPVGDSVLINNDDVVIDPIPPFSNEDGKPLNWVLAGTTFDTTPYEGQYLAFWVVVWIKDSSGNLVREIAGHGLKSIPGTLKSLADVQAEDYSNNVGFYNAEFYVLPQTAAAQTASLNNEPATIDIGKVDLSAARALPGQVIDVSATLSANGNSASGLSAVFYDGDPHAGGKAFGLERSPYIAQDGTYLVSAPYYADTCGTHQLFVVTGKDTPQEILRRAPPIRIDCGAVGSAQLGGDSGASLQVQ